MENDPDLDAMANAPITDEHDDEEVQRTTVIEGGAAGGLFLRDDSEDEDAETALRKAREDVEMADGHEQDHDSDSFAGHQLMDSAGEEGEDAAEEDDDEEDDDEEDDDPIVKTYQIHATKILSENLYLFQYLIRPANRPYEGLDHPAEARVKPRIGQVQIDIPIPESNYYDAQRAAQWSDGPLKHQTLGGSIVSGRNYLVGLVEGDELHVTPLSGVAQIRPVFKHIDDHDREERSHKRSEASEKGGRGIKAVQMSVKSTDAMPDLSTTALIRAAEEENWVKMKWQDANHAETMEVFNHMLSKKTNIMCTPITDKAAYLDMLSTVGSAAQGGTVKKEGR